MTKYDVIINNKRMPLNDLVSNSILPENINSLKLDFEVEEGNISILGLLLVLNTLLERIKNPTEYTILISNLISSAMLIKKLEADAGLGEDVF